MPEEIQAVLSPHFSLFSSPRSNLHCNVPSRICKGRFFSANICLMFCTPFGQSSPATRKLNVESRKEFPCNPFDVINAKILMDFGGGKCGLEAKQGDFDLCSCSELNTWKPNEAPVQNRARLTSFPSFHSRCPENLWQRGCCQFLIV